MRVTICNRSIRWWIQGVNILSLNGKCIRRKNNINESIEEYLSTSRFIEELI